MQQGDPLALLPDSYSQHSLPQDDLIRHNDGMHIDASFLASQNAAPQSSFIPYSTGNTTIETHNSITPAIDKKLYCPWRSCRQPYKEYTAGELKKHSKIHTKPEKCPYYCGWAGTAEKRELQAHIKIHHEPRTHLGFTCTNCSKPFTEKKNRNRHQKICCAKESLI